MKTCIYRAFCLPQYHPGNPYFVKETEKQLIFYYKPTEGH